MSENADQMKAADLLVHGTFALRRALDRLAQSVRHPGAAEPPAAEPPEEQGDEQRPMVGAAEGRSHG